jgi:hypothetical protein
MFNGAIYSEEKISRAVDVFSELLDRLLKAWDGGDASAPLSSFL